MGENQDEISIAHRWTDREVTGDANRHLVISRKTYDSKQYDDDDDNTIRR